MSTDAVLRPNAEGTYDFSIDKNGDIETRDFFDSSILVSLFTDHRATAAEMPDRQRRRGWIGDQANDDGFEGGSKIWLYEQARLTRSTLNGIAAAARNSLQWMIDDSIALDVSASATVLDNRVFLNVGIQRPSSPIDRQFFELWAETAK